MQHLDGMLRALDRHVPHGTAVSMGATGVLRFVHGAGSDLKCAVDPAEVPLPPVEVDRVEQRVALRVGRGLEGARHTLALLLQLGVRHLRRVREARVPPDLDLIPTLHLDGGRIRPVGQRLRRHPRVPAAYVHVLAWLAPVLLLDLILELGRLTTRICAPVMRFEAVS